MTRIMLIDDDAEFLEEAKVMLELAGYRVSCVTDRGYTAEILRREKPDVILLDVKMKVISGLEVAFQIREDPELKNIPIIAMSVMYPEHDFMGMCGITEKLQKPFFSEDVAQSLKRVL